MDDTFKTLLNQFLQLFLEFLTAVAIPYAFVLAHRAFNSWQARLEREMEERHITLSQAKRDLLGSLAATAVSTVEQIYRSKPVQQSAQLKREQAFQFIQGQLNRLGLEADVDDIYASIEAAVWREINAWNGTPLPPAVETTKEVPAPVLPNGVGPGVKGLE